MVDLQENKSLVKKKKMKKETSSENEIKATKRKMPKVEEGQKLKKIKKVKNMEEDDGVKSKKKKTLKFDETVKVKKIEKVSKENKDSSSKAKKDRSIKKKGDKKKGDKKEEPFVKLDKKETREKQKKDKAERKAKKVQQEVFNIGTQAKNIWEELRKEDCPEEKKATLAKQLHALVKGNLVKIIFAHDTVRVVECLMALGPEEIKQDIYLELKDQIIEMSKSNYANFFVQKLLRYGSKEQREAVFKAMEGRVAKLMKHKMAGQVVELAYNDYANAEQRNCFLQEFLGPEFRLFKEKEVRTVQELITKHPEKKAEIVKNLGANVEVLVQKGCYNHSLVHTVLNNYMTVVEAGKPRSDVVESMRDNLIHILHSREGAQAAIRCMWHGTAKDRKAIVKSLKTFVEKTCQEEYGHFVLMAMFDTVDDTKLVGKAILGELAEHWDKVVQNKFGLQVVKYLVAGRDKAYTYPDTVKLLEGGDNNEHSKKDPVVRRKELLEVAAPTALRWLGERLLAGLYDPPSTITFTAVLNNVPHSDQLSKVWSLLAEEASKPFMEGDGSKNIIEPPASNMLLKKIILKDKERAEKGVETFSSVLLATVDKDGVESWLGCNRGAFLLVFCWETNIEEIQNLVRETLKPFADTLRRNSKKTKGIEILNKKLKGLSLRYSTNRKFRSNYILWSTLDVKRKDIR